MSKPYLVVKDFTKDVNDIVKKFKRDEILVGIPEEETERDPQKDGGKPVVTNAFLLALNTVGSPAQNIPARPVLAIGIHNAQDEIANQFKDAARKALSQGRAAIRPAYERAGIIASTAVKKAINDQDGIAEPSDATLRTRRAMGFKGEKALLVTGQMRNAITYVIKGDE